MKTTGQHFRKSFCQFALLLAVILSARTVVAADPSEPAGERPAPRRFFGGHMFMPSSIVPDPFITTTLTNTTGFGQASNIKVPILDLEGEQIGELEGNLAFLFLEFGYQQSFKSRYAFHVGASGGARTGTSAEAILAEGISSIFGYSLGGSASLVRKTNWQLTGTLDLRSNTIYTVDPGSFVRSVIERVGEGDSTGAIDASEDSLLSSGNNLRALAGLRAAWTPSPTFGFTVFLESGLGQRFDEDEGDLGVVNAGAAASIDLNPSTHFPLGFLLAFRNESLSERGDDLGGSVQSAGLGLFYTGRRDFAVGIDNTWGRLSRNDLPGNIDVFQSRIVLRYDFN